jgi:hypothetical protein
MKRLKRQLPNSMGLKWKDATLLSMKLVPNRNGAALVVAGAAGIAAAAAVGSIENLGGNGGLPIMSNQYNRQSHMSVMALPWGADIFLGLLLTDLSVLESSYLLRCIPRLLNKSLK